MTSRVQLIIRDMEMGPRARRAVLGATWATAQGNPMAGCRAARQVQPKENHLGSVGRASDAQQVIHGMGLVRLARMVVLSVISAIAQEVPMVAWRVARQVQRQARKPQSVGIVSGVQQASRGMEMVPHARKAVLGVISAIAQEVRMAV